MEEESPEVTPAEDPIYGLLLTILPKFPCFLSIVGTLCVISSVLRSKSKRGHIQSRLVGSMVFFQFLAAFSWMFTNLFMPPSNELQISSIGNDTSCDAQGYLLQLVIAGNIYYASIAIYFYLVIARRWKKKRIESIEKYLHGVPIVWGVVTASIVVAMDMIGENAWNCWIQPRDSPNKRLAKIFQFVLFYIPLWSSMAVCVCSMYLVHKFIKKTEKQVLKWKKHNRKVHTKNIAMQNYLYVLSFLLCWTFPSLVRILQTIFGIHVPTWTKVVSGTLLPCQGFINAIIFFRLKYQKIKRKDKEQSIFAIVWRIVKESLFSFSCIKTNEVQVRPSVDVDVEANPTNAPRKDLEKSYIQTQEIQTQESYEDFLPQTFEATLGKNESFVDDETGMKPPLEKNYSTIQMHGMDSLRLMWTEARLYGKDSVRE